jgi:outer membrane protein assembly factor BamB
LAWLNSGKTEVTELWHNQNLLLEYDMPVHHEGFPYGFNRGQLICLDATTGEEVWSKWYAGQGMAILVDGHLAIIDSDGFFKIARAWEKGYVARGSIKLFEKSGLNEPSYADGVFYMRSFTHLAAVRVQ